MTVVVYFSRIRCWKGGFVAVPCAVRRLSTTIVTLDSSYTKRDRSKEKNCEKVSDAQEGVGKGSVVLQGVGSSSGIPDRGTRKEGMDLPSVVRMTQGLCKVGKQKKNNKLRVIVPRVASTDYISRDNVHTETLFAGYRPLFLGNASFSSGDSVVSVNSGRSSALGDIEKGALSGNPVRKAVIPWDASISGVTYSDNAFHSVPGELVANLRPFNMIQSPTESNSKKASNGQNEMIKMKVHSPKINDRSEMIDLFNTRDSDGLFNRFSSLNRDSSSGKDTDFKKLLLNSRKHYNNELQRLAYDYKFIRDDQIELRECIKKLNKSLIGKFEEITGLRIRIESKEYFLPLYIYFQSNIISTRSVNNFIRKLINFQASPIISALLSNFSSKKESVKYKEELLKNYNQALTQIMKMLPSLIFKDPRSSVDCVITRSSVPGFGRIHWLSGNTRRITCQRNRIQRGNVCGVSSINQVGIRSRSNNIRYPVNLYTKSINDIFKEWDCYS